MSSINTVPATQTTRSGRTVRPPRQADGQYVTAASNTRNSVTSEIETTIDQQRYEQDNHSEGKS